MNLPDFDITLLSNKLIILFCTIAEPVSVRYFYILYQVCDCFEINKYTSQPVIIVLGFYFFAGIFSECRFGVSMYIFSGLSINIPL
ncbi:MAG: hypothetical protein CVU06_09385 [Bacteroidetes bacterium HGW-Bacteroidetes-22]|nr:MAG: hypothetical protein CVU06_09385 [Bacteroidetes bacterium HGW-Bacteroidetes-22]